MRGRSRGPSLGIARVDGRSDRQPVKGDAICRRHPEETASEKVELEGLDVRLEHFDGGYSVCFESHTADADLADLFRGLPEDRCQLPRWGYVVKGRVSFRFADREETYEAGDAYYVPPGHTPVHYAGAEIVEFSPTDVLGETIEVVMGNLSTSEVGA